MRIGRLAETAHDIKLDDASQCPSFRRKPESICFGGTIKMDSGFRRNDGTGQSHLLSPAAVTSGALLLG